MGKMFGNLHSTENLEQAEDRVGGFEPIPSDFYVGTIKLAYAGKAPQSDAQNVTVHVEVDGREVRETIYITNKQGKNFYVDKQDSTKRHPLQGFTTIDDMCLLTTELPLVEQDTEEKTVKIYNFVEKKEIPTPVQCLTALHGKQIGLGILRQIVDKEAKDTSGTYAPTGETRTQNTIDKVFHPETKRTVNEYINEVETPEFYEVWTKKNSGKDQNKVKGGNGGAGASGSGRPGGADGGSPKKSLFGGKK